MLKDVDDKPIEPARRKAERRWRNHDVEKRLKEERAKPTPKESRELEIGEITSRDKPDGRSAVLKAQTKFAKEIREMMEGHARRAQLLYLLSIRHQRYRLLKEKLRRLEAREAEREAQRVAQRKKMDLFA